MMFDPLEWLDLERFERERSRFRYAMDHAPADLSRIERLADGVRVAPYYVGCMLAALTILAPLGWGLWVVTVVGTLLYRAIGGSS